MSLALGIDIGTSGVRVAALDREGQVVALEGAPMPAPEREGGRIAQQAELWWQATAQALDGLRAKADFAAVEAIAVDGTSGTILAVDAAGAPLGPALMYNDASAQERAAKLVALAPPGTAALGATSPLARALVLQELSGAARILHQADWIAGRLSGRFDVSDESNALKTGYDPRARFWPDWLERAGLDTKLLPVVVPAGTPTGTVARAIAVRFGLSPQVAVVAGCTDGCAAFLATGAAVPGEGVTSLGTTLTLKLLSETPVFSAAYGIYSHRIGERWLAGGASNVGGAVLLQHFSPERMAELEARLDPRQPTGLDYYPLPAPGERFPVSDPAYPPRLTPRPQSDVAFFQGLLEGIAQVETLGYRRLGELGAAALKTVRTVGGGTQSKAFAEIRRRRLDVPFRDSASLDAAAGAARLAWAGLGTSP